MTPENGEISRKYTLGIIDGPSKWDLMLALFDPWPDVIATRLPRIAKFKINHHKQKYLSIEISGISRYIFKSESWNFEGTVICGLCFSDFGLRTDHRVTGTFTTKERKGEITIWGLSEEERETIGQM